MAHKLCFSLNNNNYFHCSKKKNLVEIRNIIKFNVLSNYSNNSSVFFLRIPSTRIYKEITKKKQQKNLPLSDSVSSIATISKKNLRKIKFFISMCCKQII